MIIRLLTAIDDRLVALADRSVVKAIHVGWPGRPALLRDAYYVTSIVGFAWAVVAGVLLSGSGSWSFMLLQMVFPVVTAANSIKSAGRTRGRALDEVTVRGWQKAMLTVEGNRRYRKANRLLCLILPILAFAAGLSMSLTGFGQETQRLWIMVLVALVGSTISALCVTEYLEAATSPPPGGERRIMPVGRTSRQGAGG